MKDIDIYLVIYMICAGVLGMFFHWQNAKSKGRKLPNFFKYLFNHNRAKSGTAFSALVVVIFGLVTSGAFDQVDMTTAWEMLKTAHTLQSQFLTATILAITTGYTTDSKYNG